MQARAGGQFRRHVVDGNRNDWSWARVDCYWQPFWATLHWAFPLAALGLLELAAMAATTVAASRPREPAAQPAAHAIAHH